MKKMKNILITGSNGFIGKNLKIYLSNFSNLKIKTVRNNISQKSLEESLKNIDIIFHLAGVNRSNNLNKFNNNFLFIKKICTILIKYKSQTKIFFTSSKLLEGNRKNLSRMHLSYIKSKLKAESVLKSFHKSTGNQVFIYRLPHVMGKWARPNYNSVIATFCNNIARNKKSIIQNEDYQLSIVQIDNVFKSFEKNIYKKQFSKFQYVALKTKNITVGELYKKILQINNFLNDNITPSFTNDFDRDLYSTFITYLPKRRILFNLKNNFDDRGNFIECFKNKNFGQISFFTSKPNVQRGNHYHHLKCEIFIVLKGKAEYKSTSLNNGKVDKFVLSDKRIKIIRTVPGEMHSIKNLGNTDLIVLLWANEVFDINKPDTYFINGKKT